MNTIINCGSGLGAYFYWYIDNEPLGEFDPNIDTPLDQYGDS